jgi:hypothetical protein
MKGSNGNSNGHSNGHSDGYANRHTNGSSSITTRLSLEEQYKQDMERLRQHLKEHGTSDIEDFPHDAARASKQPLLARPCDMFAFTKTKAMKVSSFISDDVTIHTSNVTKRNNNRGSRQQSWLRTLFLDLPLLVLFSILVLSFSIDRIYHVYYVPLLEASARAADDGNLRKEHTYYERTCSVADMSSRGGEGLILKNGTTPEQAVENMMIHGTSVIPRILDPNTAKELRTFVVRRNRELTITEKIPMSQGRKRTSFGIDATEDPIVATALKEVASHALLRGLITGLVGEDPAVTEITAITAAAGAAPQVWHSDVKADGNALKFARTYAHSYSLFIALQDTTEAMGPTTMCPGTHYCANWVHDMCDANGFPLTRACPDNIWSSGDGVLLNQQVWHRGGQHHDNKAQERVVFIVSFIGRPDATRQLARGTYFHQKWLSWGHTMRDLMDADRSMAKPFSILRALSLWKPKSRNWGYDFITAAVMRMANVQMGMTAEELPVFQEVVVEKMLHIPRSLQGPITDDEEDPQAWPSYLHGTLRKMTVFFAGVNGAFMLLYSLVILILSAKDRSTTPIKTASYRMLFTHGIPILLSYQLMHSMATSEYWRKAQAGQIMRPPFGAHLESIEDDTVPSGPTTLPTRLDILVGTRFDSMILGAYDRWLDYHPGNAEFIVNLQHCSRMPISLEKQCIDNIFTTKKGRVLEQDWTDGDWHIMSPVDSRRHVEVEIAKARNSIFARFTKSIALLVAYNRFDAPPSALTSAALDMLFSLRKKILAGTKSTGKDSKFSLLMKTNIKPPFFVRAATMPVVASSAISHIEPRIGNHSRWLQPRLSDEPKFKVGDLVWINYDGGGKFFRGAITKIRKKDGALTLHYDDDEKQSKVPARLAQHDVPLVENVEVTFEKKNGKTQRGKVIRIMPDGAIDVLYGGGKVRKELAYGKYNRLDL